MQDYKRRVSPDASTKAKDCYHWNHKSNIETLSYNQIIETLIIPKSRFQTDPSALAPTFCFQKNAQQECVPVELHDVVCLWNWLRPKLSAQFPGTVMAKHDDLFLRGILGCMDKQMASQNGWNVWLAPNPTNGVTKWLKRLADAKSNSCLVTGFGEITSHAGWNVWLEQNPRSVWKYFFWPTKKKHKNPIKLNIYNSHPDCDGIWENHVTIAMAAEGGITSSRLKLDCQGDWL